MIQENFMRIGELCEIVNGGAWKQTEYVDVGIPVIQVSNLQSEKVDTSNLKQLPISSFEKYNKHTIREKDLIIATVGSHATQASAAGRTTVAPSSIDGMFLNQNAAIIRSISPDLDQSYLGIVGKSPAFQSYVKLAGKGAANQVRIAISAIKAYQFELPDIDTQVNIASTLFAYDDLIENNRRRIALLEEAARLLYREWFVYFRFPGAEHVKIVDGVPEGWARTLLGDVTTIKKGKNITRNTVKPGSVPVVAGGLSPAYFHDTANTKSPIITVSASGANAGFVNLYHQDIWASDCSYLDSNANTDIYYLYLLLKSNQAEISSMQKGAAQPHVYPKDLMRLEISFPPEAIRADFMEYVDPQFEMVKTLKNQIKASEIARDLLLPRLMDGRLEI